MQPSLSLQHALHCTVAVLYQSLCSHAWQVCDLRHYSCEPERSGIPSRRVSSCETVGLKGGPHRGWRPWRPPSSSRALPSPLPPSAAPPPASPIGLMSQGFLVPRRHAEFRGPGGKRAHMQQTAHLCRCRVVGLLRLLAGGRRCGVDLVACLLQQVLALAAHVPARVLRLVLCRLRLGFAGLADRQKWSPSPFGMVLAAMPRAKELTTDRLGWIHRTQWGACRIRDLRTGKVRFAVVPVHLLRVDMIVGGTLSCCESR